MTAVLLLNADYLPLRLISWERAVNLLLNGRVSLVEQVGQKVVRSMSEVVPWPAVVALKEFVSHRGKIKYSNKNVLARDEYTCQFCGVMPQTPTGNPDTQALTIDHVVPISRAFLRKGPKGRIASVKHYLTGEIVPATSWENTVAACKACNGRKANRTPAEAKMPLRRQPTRPNSMKALRIWLLKAQIPAEGRTYLMFD